PTLGFELAEAFDVNELGQIVATGFVDGKPHTFLLTPTDSAKVTDTGSSWTLLSCGLLGLLLLAGMRWRHRLRVLAYSPLAGRAEGPASAYQGQVPRRETDFRKWLESKNLASEFHNCL